MLNNFLSDNDPPELGQLLRMLRDFANAELTVPRGKEPVFKRSNFTRMGELGLTQLSLPERSGLTNCSHLATATTIFEFSKVQLGPAIYLSVHLMVEKLINNFSKQDFFLNTIDSLSSGKKLGAFCLTEAGAGSDAAAISTTATTDGNDYILNGEKVYITSGNVADVFLVFARTGAEKAKGISAFVVEGSLPGILIGHPETKMGCAGSPICSIRFENCRVPQSCRLGSEGDGYKIALSGLNSGRVNIAAAACGLSARALELATNYAKNRVQFSLPLSEFQGIQFMLADMLIAHRASILLTHDAANKLDSGATQDASASIAKCFATDSAMKITTDAVQIFGGAGYLADYEVERLMRDAKMLQIVEGTNQIQRILVARSLLQNLV